MSTTVNQNYHATSAMLKDPADLVTSAFDDSDEDEPFDYCVKGEDKCLTPTKYRSDKNKKTSSFYSNISNEPNKYRSYSIHSLHQDGQLSTRERVIIPTIYKNSENSQMKPSLSTNGEVNGTSINRNVAERPLSPDRLRRMSETSPSPSPTRKNSMISSSKTNRSLNDSITSRTLDKTNSQNGSHHHQQQQHSSNPNVVLSRRSTQSNVADERKASQLREQLRLGQSYRISGEIEFIEQSSSERKNSDPEFGLVFKGTIRGLDIKPPVVPSNIIASDGKTTTENSKSDRTTRTNSISTFPPDQSSEKDETAAFDVTPTPPIVPEVLPKPVTPPEVKRRRTFDFGPAERNSETEDDDKSSNIICSVLGKSSRKNLEKGQKTLTNSINDSVGSPNSSNQGEYRVQRSEERHDASKDQWNHPVRVQHTNADSSTGAYDQDVRNEERQHTASSDDDDVAEYYKLRKQSSDQESTDKKPDLYDKTTRAAPEKDSQSDRATPTDRKNPTGISEMLKRNPLAAHKDFSRTDGTSRGNTPSTDRGKSNDDSRKKKSDKSKKK